MKGEGFSAFLPYNLSFVASLLILHLHVFRQQLSDVRPKPSDVRPKPSDAHQKVSDYIYHSRILLFIISSFVNGACPLFNMTFFVPNLTFSSIFLGK